MHIYNKYMQISSKQKIDTDTHIGDRPPTPGSF